MAHPTGWAIVCGAWGLVFTLFVRLTGGMAPALAVLIAIAAGGLSGHFTWSIYRSVGCMEVRYQEQRRENGY